eukprot:IDg2448t1
MAVVLRRELANRMKVKDEKKLETLYRLPRTAVWYGKTIRSSYSIQRLEKTPSEDVLRDIDKEAVECVHGLSNVRMDWEEVFHRSVIQVPAVISAYNIFMNSVDRMDQLRIQSRIAERLTDESSSNSTSEIYSLRGNKRSAREMEEKKDLAGPVLDCTQSVVALEKVE